MRNTKGLFEGIVLVVIHLVSAEPVLDKEPLDVIPSVRDLDVFKRAALTPGMWEAPLEMLV